MDKSELLMATIHIHPNGIKAIYLGAEEREAWEKDRTKPETTRTIGDDTEATQKVTLAKAGAERLGVGWDDARRYAKALARWAKAGYPTRPQPEVLRIMRDRCGRCEWNVDGRCRKCGCRVNRSRIPLTNKIKMATEDCPLGKWELEAGGEGPIFERVVVINLKRRPGRLKQFQEGIQECQWPFVEPERFEAIDGEIVPVPDGWTAGNGGWGCMLSHLRVLEKAIIDGVKSILVFEDDAIPSDDFSDRLPRFISELPTNWDAIWLGGQNFGPANVVSENVLEVKNPHRMHAYALRGKALKDAYQKLVSSKTHCDHTLTPWIGQRYHVYAPRRPLFGQRDGRSDINGKTQKIHWWGFGDEPTKKPQKVQVDDICVTVNKVGYGEVKCDGTLGYPGVVQMPDDIAFNHAISAHANHDLILECKRPIRIRGALNLSADLQYDRDQACEFWLDWHWIGGLRLSGSTTPCISLPPGKYHLRANATPHAGWCHALWLIEYAEPATERLALVTVGSYRDGELKHVAGRLHESSARRGLFLQSFGVNKPYRGHIDGKIRKLRDWIKAIPEVYTHVMFADCKDVFLLADEKEILSKFHAMNSPIVIGGEENNWPTFNDDFRDAIIGDDITESKAKTINSGLWMAERKAAVNAFDSLVELRDELDQGLIVHPGLKTGYDDQFCWQAAKYQKRFDARIDYEHNLFMSMWGNNTSPLEAVHDGRVVTEFKTNPIALHFNGWGGIQRWWSLLK